MLPPIEEEATVDDRNSVTVQAAIRRRTGIEAGDKLRWSVDTAGALSVESVTQCVGVFEDFDPTPMGGDG